MSDEITKHLRLRITFKRHPGLNDALSWEHWRVEVFECFNGVIRWPYLVTGELDYIEVPDQWDDHQLIPTHRVDIPGVQVGTVSIENFTRACERARERALTLSGYMLDEEFPRVEEAFDGPKYSSPKYRRSVRTSEVIYRHKCEKKGLLPLRRRKLSDDFRALKKLDSERRGV